LDGVNQVKDRFIILKKMKYGEADLILHALSSKGEKVSFMARAALKSKKRFGGGVLEPTHFVEFSYKHNSSEGQLSVLQEAHLINDFHGLRTSYDRLEFALYVLECMAKVSQEGDQHSEFLFNLLGNTLKALEGAEDVAILKMHFYLKFLHQQGVMTADPWMTPFLKTSLAASALLAPERETVMDHLMEVESMVAHYLKNATL
jgi:DNA repair protein RecO (recombination protein O)